MSDNDILFVEHDAQSGKIGQIILNRPHVMNVLTLDMCQRFYEQLKQWETDPNIVAVMIKGNGDRAFCAGGDLKKLYEHRDKNPKLLRDFFWHEYRLNTAIRRFTKPYLAFLHHVTMGGGAGVSIHGTYRIAADNLCFAMPETKVGFYPDIGANDFLNRCPHHIGLYLALTGNAIDANTAYQLGLVTHVVKQTQFSEIESALLNAKTISAEVLDQFIIGSEQSELMKQADMIEHCFSTSSLSDVFQRLENSGPWGEETLTQLKTHSPTSLEITFATYQRSKSLSFEEMIQLHFDLTQQFLSEQDLYEGIRALLIDKDRAPQWQGAPSKEKVAQYLEFKGKHLDL